MSTWEARMSARARARMADGRERQAAAEAEVLRLETIATLFAARAALLAAPPSPCAACYIWWGASFWHPAGCWGHAGEAVVEGPVPPDAGYDTDPAHWCHHACHEGRPYYTVPPAMAA